MLLHRRLRIVLGCVTVAGLGILSCSNDPGPAADKSAAAGHAKRPNVVVFMLDDVGFGHLSPFGGPIPVPNIERVAAKGLRYTSFHTTALCSPSRAAFLTGRNHHSVGTGKITELASDNPGYTGRIPKSAATFAQVLRENGYSTMALGKWHNTPVEDVTPDGPYDLWPEALGFDRFYGFMGGETDQWAPNLWDQKTPVDPGAGRTDYLLDRDLADHAVAFVDGQAGSPQPFLLYLASGTAHAPHHAPKDYIDRNKGRFDEGWDRVREETLERQKSLGIVPADAQLPARPDVIAAWSDLSSDEKRLFARMQEVYAGAVEYADAQFGRVLDELQKTGQLDDTLVIVTSDNGASGEGGLDGSVNEARRWNGVPQDPAQELAAIDDLGGPKAFNHYPAGWALAGNTPGQYWKQTVHEGGVRDPFLMAWPNGIAARGEIRSQFTHLVDVAPTIFELVGVSMPDAVDGVTQMPLEGVSFAPTLAGPSATSAKSEQYFEMFGNRGIWSRGYKAVVFHGRWPWEMGASNPLFDRDRWELYDLTTDPGEAHDLAAKQPDKLTELQKLFDEQARAHNVYPLDDSTMALVSENMKRLIGDKTVFTYSGVTRGTPEPLSPPVKNHAHTIVAKAKIGDAGADGVIATVGGRFAGWSLYVKDGFLTYTHDFVGEASYTIRASEPVPRGEVELKFVFTKTGDNAGRGSLYMNGKLVGSGDIPHTVPALYSATESFDTGQDTGTSAGDYDLPFPFRGTLESVTVTIDDVARGALDVPQNTPDEQSITEDE